MTYQQSLVAFQLGRYDLARRLLGEHLSVCPQDATAIALLSATSLRLGDGNRALEEAQAAVAANPQIAYCHYVLSLCLHGAGQFLEAEIAIEQALSLDSGNATYLSTFARMQPPRAARRLELLDEALSCNPTHKDALQQKYFYLVGLRQSDEASRLRQQILSLYPEDAAMHAELGFDALSVKLDHKNARQHFEEALRLDPGSVQFADGLTRTHYYEQSRLGRSLARISGNRLLMLPAICFLFAVAYAVLTAVANIELSEALMVGLTCGPMLVIVIVLVLESVSKGWFYLRVWKDPSFSRLARRPSPVTVRTLACFACGIICGATMIGLDIALRSPAVRASVPHWLYSSWEVILSKRWVILAPIVFGVALIGSVLCLWAVISVHVRRAPLTTGYFVLLYLFFLCLGILLLYWVVAVWRPGEWFLAVVLGYELLAISIPSSQTVRNFGKRIIRTQKLKT